MEFASLGLVVGRWLVYDPSNLYPCELIQLYLVQRTWYQPGTAVPEVQMQPLRQISQEGLPSSQAAFVLYL
jgi:hypothetical protein